MVGEDHVYEALKAIRALLSALRNDIIEQGPGSEKLPRSPLSRASLGEIHP